MQREVLHKGQAVVLQADAGRRGFIHVAYRRCP
jgi:hypothetical protein